MSGTETPFDESKVVDSPSDWVNSHIQTYVRTDGAEGHEFRGGAPILLLTVLGRKSGVWRRTALIYGRAGDAYVVVASKGGAPTHPVWYTNLVAHPEVHVQVKGEKFTARARVAEGEERTRLWTVMSGIWPDYDAYQAHTPREIPIVVLDPVK
ncbi:nitroreductase family deazaflavin-dependent oxidoreductase [Actinospica durhamensis]|uniref:Nitroreductase family deazaflavin-dependent oxidoreductase n=1 Tax=Actinospica durhamensis TaxID=1508375 RepID=A0A941IVE7_9ACTN|nr:nitroreductase family deazaflavin-dependent oxidoreductase [Actinospica durhamensis]MBR7837041.1 nitroreductase family deazaflavin-dependent oxidoreductase [Actinospica durhamensis]